MTKRGKRKGNSLGNGNNTSEPYKGVYSQIGSTPAKDATVQFHVVVTEGSSESGQFEIFHVPEAWLSEQKDFVLYPPPQMKVSNKYPSEWGPQTFQRHCFPERNWEEFPVKQMITKEPVSLSNAIKTIKKATGQASADTLGNSDPDKVSGVGARSINKQIHASKKNSAMNHMLLSEGGKVDSTGSNCSSNFTNTRQSSGSSKTTVKNSNTSANSSTSGKNSSNSKNRPTTGNKSSAGSSATGNNSSSNSNSTSGCKSGGSSSTSGNNSSNSQNRPTSGNKSSGSSTADNNSSNSQNRPTSGNKSSGSSTADNNKSLSNSNSNSDNKSSAGSSTTDSNKSSSDSNSTSDCKSGGSSTTNGNNSLNSKKRPTSCNKSSGSSTDNNNSLSSSSSSSGNKSSSSTLTTENKNSSSSSSSASGNKSSSSTTDNSSSNSSNQTSGYSSSGSSSTNAIISHIDKSISGSSVFNNENNSNNDSTSNNQKSSHVSDDLSHDFLHDSSVGDNFSTASKGSSCESYDSDGERSESYQKRSDLSLNKTPTIPDDSDFSVDFAEEDGQRILNETEILSISTLVSNSKLDEVMCLIHELRDKFEASMSDISYQLKLISTQNASKDCAEDRYSVYFHEVVTGMNLPKNTVEDLAELDKTLSSNDMAVCVVGRFVNVLSSVTRIDELANACFSMLITSALSEITQWKSGGRKNDPRPGLNRYLNILAVFGVVLIRLTEKKSWPKLDVWKICGLFQKARKQSGKRFRQGGGAAEQASPDNLEPRSEEHLFIELQKRCDAIEHALKHFNRPS